MGSQRCSSRRRNEPLPPLERQADGRGCYLIDEIHPFSSYAPRPLSSTGGISEVREEPAFAYSKADRPRALLASVAHHLSANLLKCIGRQDADSTGQRVPSRLMDGAMLSGACKAVDFRHCDLHSLESSFLRGCMGRRLDSE